MAKEQDATKEQATLESVKETIEAMDPQQRAEVFDCAKILIKTVRVYGRPGMLALALVGAEVASHG